MQLSKLELPALLGPAAPDVFAVVNALLSDRRLHLTDLFVREDRRLVGSGMAGLVQFELAVDEITEWIPTREALEEFIAYVFEDDWRTAIKRRALDKGRRLAEDDFCRFNAHLHDTGRLQIAVRRHPRDPMTLAQIGAPAGLTTLAEEPRGLLLFVGRTSAGKSTTQAAVIEHINRKFPRHIVRIEDPLEIPVEEAQSLITVRQVGIDVDSADLAVHDALRQRPDVICVSEVRDAPTAQALFEAVDSGHLVIATGHGPNPVDALARFLAYFGEAAPQRAQILSQVLLGVIGQIRLPRRDGEGYGAYFELLAGAEQQSVARRLIAEQNWPELKRQLHAGQLAQCTSLSESLGEAVRRGELDADVAVHAAFDRPGLLANLKDPQAVHVAARSAEGGSSGGRMGRLITAGVGSR